MNGWKRIFATAMMVAASLASGCRSGVSKHGKTLSLFLVPMYKQPAGYSSSYRRHLAMAAPVGQPVAAEIGDAKAKPVTPSEISERANKSKPVNKSEEVFFPTANGPERHKKQTMGDQQSTGSLDSPSQHGNRKTRILGLIQPASLDRQGE